MMFRDKVSFTSRIKDKFSLYNYLWTIILIFYLLFHDVNSTIEILSVLLQLIPEKTVLNSTWKRDFILKYR